MELIPTEQCEPLFCERSGCVCPRSSWIFGKAAVRPFVLMHRNTAANAIIITSLSEIRALAALVLGNCRSCKHDARVETLVQESST